MDLSLEVSPGHTTTVNFVTRFPMNPIRDKDVEAQVEKVLDLANTMGVSRIEIDLVGIGHVFAERLTRSVRDRGMNVQIVARNSASIGRPLFSGGPDVPSRLRGL